MNSELLKKLDAVLGRLAAAGLPHPEKCFTDDPASILLIRPGGIGDAVHLIPAIIALKEQFPQTAIDLLAERRNRAVFTLTPHVRRVYGYDNPLEFLEATFGKYDVVIDTEQWYRLSAVAARIVRAPVKIGFDANERRRLFTHPVPYAHDEYEADSFFRLIVPLGVNHQPGNSHPYLIVPEVDAQRAAELLANLEQRKFVAIFPGASIPERRWGVERFAVVARKLGEYGYASVVVGSGDDRVTGNGICAAGGLNLAGKSSLSETAAIISRAAVLVSGDSGILHLGVGLGVPTVSLFGPGIAAKWAPRGDMHIVLNKKLSCSPCTHFGNTPHCPHNARCLAEITVDEVTAAVLRLLEKQQ